MVMAAVEGVRPPHPQDLGSGTVCAPEKTNAASCVDVILNAKTKVLRTGCVAARLLSSNFNFNFVVESNRICTELIIVFKFWRQWCIYNVINVKGLGAQCMKFTAAP
jgi:hypothetical protein